LDLRRWRIASEDAREIRVPAARIKRAGARLKLGLRREWSAGLEPA
jgi:hypothetical protein